MLNSTAFVINVTSYWIIFTIAFTYITHRDEWNGKSWNNKIERAREAKTELDRQIAEQNLRYPGFFKSILRPLIGAIGLAAILAIFASIFEIGIIWLFT